MSDVLDRDGSKHEIDVTPIDDGKSGYLVSCICPWEGFICTHKKFVPAIAERHMLAHDGSEAK